MNYIGYFRSLEGNTLYSVKLITDSGNSGYTEVKLSGTSPFVVSFAESSTPFEPTRTSTATVKVVRGDYLEDIYSPYAQSTMVILHNEQTGKNEWVGWLVPKIYNQEYEDCLEEIELEAADCISNLQYFDYKPLGSAKAIVSVKDILDSICDKCGLVKGYLWTRSKKVGTVVMLPSYLMVSEQNFFTSDTDEGWKLDEVLEELCRYFGFTLFQWGEWLCFADLEYLSDNDDLYCSVYSKERDYAEGYTDHIGRPFTVSENTYRGNGADISFEPIFNKVTVRDNLYAAEDLVPDIFDDSYLINRIDPCDFYSEHEVPAESPYKPSGSDQKVADSGYTYFQRPFNHEVWESQYLEPASGTPVTLSRQTKASTACIRDYVGGTIVDLGVVRNPYRSSSDIRYQTIVSSAKDTTRYLCITQKGLSWNRTYIVGETTPYEIFRLKPGFKSLCPFSEDAYLVINYKIMYDEFVNRGYINPEWIASSGTTSNSSCGSMNFRVTIGDKWWQPYHYNGFSYTITNTWNNSASGSSEWNTDSVFAVLSEWPDGADTGKTQTVYNTLNYVSWQDELGVEGYKIPLSGVSMLDEIIIEVFLPATIFHNTQSKNQYCWVSELAFKIAETGQANENADGNDITYENVINTDAVNELSDISLKFSTRADFTKPAYSNVVLYRNGKATLLETVKEDSLGGTSQKPEENLIEKYVKQYSTPTKRITSTQVISGLEPWNKVFGMDVDNPENTFVILGGTIDYAASRQTITMINLK